MKLLEKRNYLANKLQQTGCGQSAVEIACLTQLDRVALDECVQRQDPIAVQELAISLMVANFCLKICGVANFCFVSSNYPTRVLPFCCEEAIWECMVFGDKCKSLADRSAPPNILVEFDKLITEFPEILESLEA